MANAPKRLNKVAKELNVGIGTIVEFLGKKGHEIEAKPTSKISPELYEILLEQFMPDKAAKEKSQELKSQKEERTTISLDDDAQEEAEEDDDDSHDEVLIENVGSDEEEEKPSQSEPETPEPKAEQSETKAEESKEKEAEKPEAKEEADSGSDSKSQEDDNKPEIEKEEKQLGEDGPRLVGKIDLEGMNLKTRPSRSKKDKEKEKEAEKKAKAKKEAEKKEQEKAAIKAKEEEAKAKKEAESKKAEEDKKEKKEEEETSKGPEHHETKYEKLSGPKVMGKIDLPEKPKKKKPVASSSDEKDTEKPKKKKRKRIKAKGVNPEKEARKNRNKKGGKPSTKKRGPKHEPTEEEIQKEIKDTLARLQGGSKNKGAKFRKQRRDEKAEQREKEAAQQEAEKSILKVTEFVTASELANMMDVSVNDVISACMSLGMMVSINQRLDAETLSIVAEEFGYQTEIVKPEIEEDVVPEEEEDDPDKLEPRSPIVTVMGHVDHGKTSLLDYIRKENVIAGEAGGITQHIGAYNVEISNGKHITFLDTPGHEAFTAMRARGAQITDLAIIVIAADDSVMPQTKEAINHAQAAGVPMVFAFNKIDKPGANADKIREELAGMDILVEDWGGKFQAQEISAKKGEGIEDLLEKITLEADILELKANPDRTSTGTVIEAELDKGRGYVTTLLVQSGTLEVGDTIVAGSHYCKVRAMFDERGQKIEKAGPSQPVSMLGFNGAPNAGDRFVEYKDEREAKNIANKREQLQREQGIRSQKHITLDEIGRRLAIGDFQELNIIVKGDVDGSVEALADSLLKLSTDTIQVNVIHKSVGQISDSDVLLASASDAIIVGFQVRPSSTARKLAEKEEIDIRLYSVIYDAIEEVRAAMEGMLKPKVEEKIVANVEVRETFKISKVGTIAGCYVTEGKITRNTKVRLIRDGVVIYDGRLGSLKRFKDDVKEVAAGYECGLNIENYNDIKVGDVVEGYEEVEVKQTL
ncbi:translation initiation factor IF-2 [Salibacter halophilus]|uniref:Translation initiation factor IF-2 n=1 Tax=Salibacter halophilus TaxID=1803916 RepID=A0A6N6M586_9FLAO|nr:translation initiation factor IF-2 [Salibacter halophilus]KAB1063238.1 translation initiation factor IF-2 [Salibacter halophilus]